MLIFKTNYKFKMSDVLNIFPFILFHSIQTFIIISFQSFLFQNCFSDSNLIFEFQIFFSPNFQPKNIF